MRAYILFPSNSPYENGWYSGDSLESIGRRLFGRSQYIWVRKRHNPEDPYPYAYYRQEPRLGHSVLLASVRYVEDDGSKPKGRPKTAPRKSSPKKTSKAPADSSKAGSRNSKTKPKATNNHRATSGGQPFSQGRSSNGPNRSTGGNRMRTANRNGKGARR